MCEIHVTNQFENVFNFIDIHFIKSLEAKTKKNIESVYYMMRFN